MDVMSAQMFLPPPSLARADDVEPVPELLERLRLDLLAKLPDQRPASASVVSQRLLEAMDPVLSEALLPKRKGDLPLGSRDERAVSGYRSPSQRPGGGAPLSVPVTVQLLSLGGATGLDEACVTALGIQGIQIARRASSSTLDLQASALVILDVGSDLSSAQVEMGRIRAKLPDAQLVVCADGLDTTTMNVLIEAGAADIARYPIDINTFVRKLKRLVRRFAG
jgi:serine/threonine-protein kinase